MVQINDDYYEDLDAGQLSQAARRSRGRTAGEIGSQNGRLRSEPHRRPDGADGILRRGRQERPLSARRSAPRQSEETRMLQDKDRIFQNLYGYGDWGLEGAQEARRLGRHQGPARKGPGLDHQRDEGVGPARARRRRLPDRPEMVLHAQARSGAAVLSGGQRRRIRARHLQGSRDHAQRPASAGRRLPGRRLRHGRQRRLYLYARRVHPASASACRRRSTRPMPPI